MSLDHLPPAFAPLIWAKGEILFLSLPSPIEGARPQVLQFPLTVRGLNQVLRLLRERETTSFPLLGTKSTPIQHEVDKLTRTSTKPPEDPEMARKAGEWLRKRGFTP
jgi:hypothetical protein